MAQMMKRALAAALFGILMQSDAALAAGAPPLPGASLLQMQSSGGGEGPSRTRMEVQRQLAAAHPVALDPAMTTESVALLTRDARPPVRHEPATAGNALAMIAALFVVVLMMEALGITDVVRVLRRSLVHPGF